MPPAPNRDHQGFQFELEAWLRTHWARPQGNEVYHEINVTPPGGWPNDYRIPDLVLLRPDRFEIDRNEYFEGAPTVVVEIRSPGDESYEKMPFYAELGVPEVWIIDRSTKAPEVYHLRGGEYQQQTPDGDGWLHSAATGVQLRPEAGGKIALRIVGNDDSRRLLPER